MSIAAAYARYSSDEQRPTSIDDQLRRCRDVAEKEGLTIEERLTFSDNAVSGLDKGQARRQYQRLIDAIEARECSVVIADEVSRLTREVEEGGRLMKLVDRIGLRVLTADGVDTAREGWRPVWMLKLMAARMEVESTSKRTTRGMLGQLDRGYQIAQPPFGYRAVLDVAPTGRVLGTTWVIQEEEAAIVRRIFECRHQGMSARLIAVELQKGSVLPPGASRSDGKPYWRPPSVSRLWANPIYRGVFVWNGSGYSKSRARRRRETLQTQAFERPALRIVSDELWASCNRKRAAGRTEPAPRGGGKRLFSGLVRCGDCNSLLSLGNCHPSQSLYCAQCEAANRVGAQNGWIGYSSVAAARSALLWVLRRLFTGEVRDEFNRRLAERIQEGPLSEQEALKQRLKDLEAVVHRLKLLMMNPHLAHEVFEPEMQAKAQELRAVKHRLQRVGEHIHEMSPEVLKRQCETDPIPLLESLLGGAEEPYKTKATLRRLLSGFDFVRRPRKGCSIFRIRLKPGVCLAEFSDTVVIDDSEIEFEVEASTTNRRPVRWTVAGQRL